MKREERAAGRHYLVLQGLHDRLVGEVPCRVDGACLFVADRVGVSPRLVARGVTVDGRMVLTEVEAPPRSASGPEFAEKADILASVRRPRRFPRSQRRQDTMLGL